MCYSTLLQLKTSKIHTFIFIIEAFKTLKEALKRAPNARAFGKGVKFTPQDEDEYRYIQRYLSDLEGREKISWFSYSLPAEKSLKVAIRGLPADTNPA